MTHWHDHFSGHAARYAAHRPDYPPALFEHVAELAPGRALALDCATGNGQAAVALAGHFGTVVATDASAAQIAEAVPHERVTYRVAPAESSGLADASVDAVTVAQALHWLDLDRFYAETRRVLRPGGVCAAWCYGLFEVSTDVDAVVHDFYARVVGPDWPPERRLVDDGYRSLPFPFAERASPPLSIEREWTLAETLAYVATWSAVQRHDRRTGASVVDAWLAPRLAPLWPSDERRPVRWSVSLRAGTR